MVGVVRSVASVVFWVMGRAVASVVMLWVVVWFFFSVGVCRVPVR